MKALFHKKFAKQMGKFSQNIQKAFQKRLELFLNDPTNQLLNNHGLTGRWSGYKSINISGDLRAVFEMVDNETAYFIAFGTHSQLYG